MDRILVAMIGKNEFVNVKYAVTANKQFDDFVYVDSGSTDGVLDELYRQQINVISINTSDLSIIRKACYEYALSNEIDWLLLLDADEQIDSNFFDYLSAMDKIHAGYVVGFQMYYLGKPLKYCRHRPRIRFVNVKKTIPIGNEIDDTIFSESVGNVPRKYQIVNNDNSSIYKQHNKQLKKALCGEEQYIPTENSEHSLFKRVVLRYLNSWPFTKAFAYFFYHYFFKLGFLDGRLGFAYCFNYAFLYHITRAIRITNNTSA